MYSKDFGQAIYAYVHDGFATFTMNCITHSSANNDHRKLAPLSIALCKTKLSQINESNIVCEYYSAIFINSTTEAHISECTLNNITAVNVGDVITFRSATGTAIVEKVVFTYCTNAYNSTPLENCDATFKNNMFAGCMNFDPIYYSTSNGNMVLSATKTCVLYIERDRCINRLISEFNNPMRSRTVLLISYMLINFANLIQQE